MKRMRCLVLLLAVLLSACGGGVEEPEEGLVLWDCTGAEESHGPALSAQPYAGEADPEALLAALLAGPVQEDLYSPFPRGVALQSCTWDEERPGVLLVDLSEQYGALADISLSLADYAIALTLSQADGVEGVEITARGHSVSYRSHQLLSAQEAVLWDNLAQAQKTLDNPADSR